MSTTEAVGSLVALIIWLAVALVFIAAYWTVFQKAGKPGWMSIIPLLNMYVLLKIIGRPGWWLLLMFIPFVNFVILILVMVDLARSFGRGIGFALGLILLSPIFFLILAFGGSRYVGPTAQPMGRASLA
jgi:hypothetical protein